MLLTACTDNLSRFLRRHWVFLVILVLAAVLRLGNLDLIEFKADEVRHLWSALRIVQEGHLPVIGSTASTGASKPPLMTYLLAIPLYVSRDPRGASAFIAVLNLVAIGGCYYLTIRYFGERAAIIASLLYAVNPWAIVYSRKIFTADVLAPFTTLMLIGLFGAIIREKKSGIAVAIVALACLLLITFSTVPLALVLILLLILYWRRVDWRRVILSGTVSVVLFAPYLYYDYRHGFANIRGLLSGSTQSGGWSTQALRFAAWIQGGFNFASHAGESYRTYMSGRLPLGWLDWAAIGLFALSFVYLVICIARGLTRQEDVARHVILALWIAVPILFSAREPTGLHPHYFVVIYPAGFVAMGVSANALLEWQPASKGAALLARSATWIVIGAIVLWQVYVSQYTFAFVAKHDTSGGYGIPFRFTNQAAQLAIAAARDSGVDEVWLITEGVSPDYDDVPVALDYLLAPSARGVFLGQGNTSAMLLPADEPAVYLVTTDVAQVGRMIETLGGDKVGAVGFPGEERGARIYALPSWPMREIAGLPAETLDNRLDAGLRMLGYDWPSTARAGEMAELATYWVFGNVPPAVPREQHSLFNHLIDSKGKTWAQQDGIGLPERYWQQGYVLVNWFELDLPSDLPPGDYYVFTGLYRLSDGQRSHVLDAGGNPVGDSISLGPLPIGVR